MWFYISLFTTLVGPLLIIGETSSVLLTRITPTDIVNGGLVCPNTYPVEFTCSGIEVSFLEWQRNGESIGTFTRHSNGSEVQRVGPFVLILDSITMRSTGANVTSRLVGNISDFISGDRITCVGDTAEDSATVNYSQTGSPPPVPTNFSVSVETDNTTVDIASVNAFHLGLNIVFGILALFQTVIAVIFFKKEGTKNNGSRYYAAIVLLAIEGAFLVLVLLLWIVSGTSNGNLQQASLQIAAYATFALFLYITWLLLTLAFLAWASRCQHHHTNIQMNQRRDLTISSNEAYGAVHRDEEAEEVIPAETSFDSNYN